MTPFRLVFVSHSFPPPDAPEESVGGMQRVSVDLQAALLRRPDVELDTWAPPMPYRHAGRRTTAFIARLTLGLPWRARHADAVLFSAIVTAPIAPAIRPRMRGVALASIAHGRDVTLPVPIHQWWLRKSFPSLDAVLSVSRATADACEARGLDPARSWVCPNGIEPGAATPPADRPAARRALRDRLALPPDAVVLLAVGRQVERKGTAWLVAHVLPRLPPRACLVVVGEGPETAVIEAAAQAAGVAHRVRQLGLVPEAVLAAARHGADVFVMPNLAVADDLEGFGMVVLEAGLSGLPTVAARIDGIVDAVSDPVSGRLVTSGDAAAWAGALRQFVDQPDAAWAVGAQARAYVQERFLWDRVVECHLGHLRAARDRLR